MPNREIRGLLFFNGKNQFSRKIINWVPPFLSDTPILAICLRCLCWVKTLEDMYAHHRQDCSTRLPGRKVYSKDGINVYEVKFQKSPDFVFDLLLIAKLLLDEKDLMTDASFFNFYIFTKEAQVGFESIFGYFSKPLVEATPRNNVTVIMTFPPFMKQGLGWYMIDFSYILSRREGEPAGPERPFSAEGKAAYTSYWRHAIYAIIAAAQERGLRSLKLEDISKETGFLEDNVKETIVSCQDLKCSRTSVFWKPDFRIPPQKQRLRPDPEFLHLNTE